MQSNKIFKEIYPKTNFQLTDIIGSMDNSKKATLFDVQEMLYKEDLENQKKK